jgi:circadian clock protein KaiB
MHPSPPNSEHDQYFPEAAQEVADYLRDSASDYYKLRLYVSKGNPRSIRAIRRIQKLCEDYLPGRYDLEIVDIHEHPELLQQDQVFAVPTLIKHLPLPLHRLIGDMSDLDSVIGALGL